MKRIVFIIILISTAILSAYGYNIYTESHRATPQCKRAYENYIDYMKDVNKIAIENGFGEQGTVSLYEFCK